MQKPQIIVIPQSMLTGQKSLLKLAPAVTRSPMLSSNSPLLSATSRPVAAVVGSKRPAPTTSPISVVNIKEEKEEVGEDSGPVRKRANLDHLSPEERLMRRKLKNRVAAQTARDKKKAATDSMEQKLQDLEARLQESLNTNANLMKTNTQLQVQNAVLIQQNTELQNRLAPAVPLSPPSSPTPSCSLSLSPPSPPMSPALASPLPTLALPPPETAALTRVPLQQEPGGSARLRGCPPDPGLSSRDLTPWGRAAALAVACAQVLATRTSPPPPPSPPLPLKKRPTPS